MKLCGFELDVLNTGTVIIGSGCAGLASALRLYEQGQQDMLLLTDGMNRGTSRNAGSDKQTYYKLSIAGSTPDSVLDMAKELVSEGVNGDTALAEAACSTRAFFRLVELGVPFPTNEYGEYIGYQTDHDTRGRATSAGPLTSRMMTEALERKLRELQIPVLDRVTAFEVLVADGKASGILGYDMASGNMKLIRASSVILATGGPARVYEASVFPGSQAGMTGMAIRAGARMANLHQWQYGLASTKFRWNVSGSYQQVLPRYVSVDPEGNEHEFLTDYFANPLEAVQNVFLKGYQWPFDVRKAEGSSRVDLAVHCEHAKGRRVFMDFRRNPSCLHADLSNLTGEAKAYLVNTGSLQSTPIERLRHMNTPAVELYRDHHIDLETEMLEVRVCAQHHNGGIAVDANWQTNIPGLYAAGEAAGTFGAYRPGGTALNSTQVGALRAAFHIAHTEQTAPPPVEKLLPLAEKALEGLNYSGSIIQTGLHMREQMSLYGAHLRDLAQLERLAEQINDIQEKAAGTLRTTDDMEARLRLRDQLTTQRSLISAMQCAAKTYGSTGAGMVLADQDGVELTGFGISMLPHCSHEENWVVYTERTDTYLEAARPIPQGEQVFEKAWKTYQALTKVNPCVC